MSTDAILSKARMIQTEINVYKQEISQLNYKLKDQQEKIKENKEKIKLNKQLPYLVANVVEVRPSSLSAPEALNPLAFKFTEAAVSDAPSGPPAPPPPGHRRTRLTGRT